LEPGAARCGRRPRGDLDRVASTRAVVAAASAVVLAGSALLTVYLKTSRLEQLWYGGRAVAESAKSMSWRYMMGAEPYFIGLGDAEADRKFVAGLKSIIEERKQLAFGFGGEFSAKPHISQRMRDVRAANFADRKSTYLSGRVSDQRKWYGDQARSNRSAENRYFVLIISSQLLAFVAAILLVALPESRFKLTGLFVSLAGALIGWLQLKQHKEQAQSYSVAEIELGFVQEEAAHVGNDRELSDFVADAENAISREHTLWIARRDRT
jgi:hypothetical protein